LLTDDEERELVSRMTMHPLSELEKRDWSNCLVFFPGKSAFDAKFDPNFDSGRGDSSPWYWEPVDDERILAEHFSPALQGPARPWAGNLKHCAWDPGVGHDRPGSASIHRDKPGASLWFVDELGPGWYCPPFPKTKQLTITAYVKTKGVEGKGAFIAADCPGESPLRMISARLKKNNPHRGYESEKITGTRDWTKVTCVVPKPPRGRGVIQLRLEGTGQAWFDDVVVEEMQNDKE